MTPMWIASLIEPDGSTPRGFITTADALHVAIICRRIDGEWTPECGIARDDDVERRWRRLALPSCFALDPGAADALEDVYSH
jgi:hypothetical protein